MIEDEGPGCEVVETRQAVYRFLHAALCPPTPEQHDWMRRAAFAESIGVVGDAFGVACPEGELVPEDYADHESRYLACFEVGMPSPLVPLLASHYKRREPVPQVIHEHKLFFRCFAMRTADMGQAPADHLVYQLAFLIHLDELLHNGRLEPDSVLWARQDFLTRHVHRWVPEASRQAHEKHLPAVYCTLLALLAAGVEEDLERTTAARLNKPAEAK